MTRIPRAAFPAAGLVVLAVVAAGCGSGSGSSGGATAPASSGGASAVVATASNPRLHETVLVDANGRTLYRLSAETGGRFICTGACTKLWHPLDVRFAAAARGSVGSLGTVKRPDGTLQVTYRGMPLYTFARDRGRGDAAGQGIKDVGTWTAVSASAAGGGASAPAQTQTTTRGSYGY